MFTEMMMSGGGTPVTLEKYTVAGSTSKTIAVNNGIVQGYYTVGQQSSAINVVVRDGALEMNKSGETATYNVATHELTVSSTLAINLYVIVAD